MAIKRNPIIEAARRPFFVIRNNGLIYRNLVNRKHRVKRSEFPNLDIIQRDILDNLNKFGIAMVHFDKIFMGDDFGKFTRWVEENECNLKQKSKKKFLFTYYGTEDPEKVLDLSNPFVELYLSERLLQIVISYLGYIPNLNEVYIEKTVPTTNLVPTYSQNWHRDPEEKKTLKIFLYLNDVTIESGPFTYILKSQPTSKSKISKKFPQKLPHGSYPDSVDITKITKPSDHLVATAPKGTLIFCDTAGIHKGGNATKYERIMSTGFYPSKKYSEKPLYKLNNVSKIDLTKLRFSNLAKRVLNID
jgi:hypothetical protein